MIELAELLADHFRPMVGRTFDLEPEIGPPLPATLLEVREHAAGAWPNAARVPFTIVFRISPGSAFPPGLLALSAPELGRHRLFFSRVAADRLEAVFN